MRGVDPSTQFLFLQIQVELAIPEDRRSIRGIHTELTVEEISRRPHVHLEETYSVSWDARFRIQRRAGRTRSPDERLVQVLVHIRKMERIINQPNMIKTCQFVHAVAHAEIADPHALFNTPMFTRLGEERFRDTCWIKACRTLYSIVTHTHMTDCL